MPNLRLVDSLMNEREQLADGIASFGGGGPYDPNMELRLGAIEAILPTLATKADMEGLRADLHKMDASIVRWVIATVLTLFLGFAGLFFTMQSSINGALERAAKSVPSPQPSRDAPQAVQPIVIQIPQAQPTPVSSPPEKTP